MLIQHYGKQAIDGDVNFDLCFPGFLAFVFSSFCAFCEFLFLGSMLHLQCGKRFKHNKEIFETTTTMFFKNGTIQ
jgi:hypothetical protein